MTDLGFTIGFFIMRKGFWNIMNRLRRVMNFVGLMVMCRVRMMVGFMNRFRVVVECGFRMVMDRFGMMGRFRMVNRFRMMNRL